MIRNIAGDQARTHLPDEAIVTAGVILVDREKHLPALVESFLQGGDRAAFKELLIPCAAQRESAWKVCGLLAQAYPEQVAAIAQSCKQFVRGPR